MYLSKLSIENFRGIKKMNVQFHKRINIIIGENGSNKSAVIDAIRLLYNMGEPLRDLSVSFSDFHESVTPRAGARVPSRTLQFKLYFTSLGGKNPNGRLRAMFPCG
jgi:putative ATP-dependent endonuclease of OLD family